MLQKIGDTAGRVWDVLKVKGEMSVSQLSKAVKETDAITYQALGWLAREGKIQYTVTKNRTTISLKE